MRTTGANVSGGGGALLGLPKNYSDMAQPQETQTGLDLNNTKKKNSEKLREDAKKDERGKKAPEPKPEKSPTPPDVPPMPGESKVKVKQVVK